MNRDSHRFQNCREHKCPRQKESGAPPVEKRTTSFPGGNCVVVPDLFTVSIPRMKISFFPGKPPREGVDESQWIHAHEIKCPLSSFFFYPLLYILICTKDMAAEKSQPP